MAVALVCTARRAVADAASSKRAGGGGSAVRRALAVKHWVEGAAERLQRSYGTFRAAIGSVAWPGSSESLPALQVAATRAMSSPRYLRVVRNAEATLRDSGDSPGGAYAGSPRLSRQPRRTVSYRQGAPSPTLSPSPRVLTSVTRRVIRQTDGSPLREERAHQPLNDFGQPLAPLEYTRDLEQHPGGNTSALGLRAAVHSAHGQHAGSQAGASKLRHAPVTYLVATYTGELTDKDRRQPWYQALDDDQLVELDRLGDDLPHTQGEVSIELIGEGGKTSGYQKLLDAGPNDYHAFRTNAVDEFTLTCDYLGDIQAINVSVDGSTVPPSDIDVSPWMQSVWKLDKVVVSCIRHTRRPPNRWCGCTCVSKPSGDHAKKTGRTKGTIWHFVPPPGQEWIGEMGTGDPQTVSHSRVLLYAIASKGTGMWCDCLIYEWRLRADASKIAG